MSQIVTVKRVGVKNLDLLRHCLEQKGWGAPVATKGPSWARKASGYLATIGAGARQVLFDVEQGELYYRQSDYAGGGYPTDVTDFLTFYASEGIKQKAASLGHTCLGESLQGDGSILLEIGAA
jgi:hypothetical protein